MILNDDDVEWTLFISRILVETCDSVVPKKIKSKTKQLKHGVK